MYGLIAVIYRVITPFRVFMSPVEIRWGCSVTTEQTGALFSRKVTKAGDCSFPANYAHTISCRHSHIILHSLSKLFT